MSINLTRGGFICGAAAFAATMGCSATPTAGGKKRWYKGNLHTHTFWSDGKAFPEESVMWYKSRGYNFLGLSDHNLFQDDPDRWVGVIGDDEKDVKPAWAKSKPHRYTYNIKRRYFDAYMKAFPDATTRTDADGKIEARLSTFAELSARFNSSGEFLLVPDVEATRSVEYADGRYHQLHMNYVNVPELLPSFTVQDFTRTKKDIPLGAFLAEHARETAALARKHGRRPLFILNHPIWTWYDVGPEVLIDAPDVRFFEVCNGGSPFGPADELPADGLDTDRFSTESEPTTRTTIGGRMRTCAFLATPGRSSGRNRWTQIRSSRRWIAAISSLARGWSRKTSVSTQAPDGSKSRCPQAMRRARFAS
jgi:hypothetical protein